MGGGVGKDVGKRGGVGKDVGTDRGVGVGKDVGTDRGVGKDVGVGVGVGVGVRRRGITVVCGRCGENIQRHGCSCDVGRARGEAPRQGWVVVEKD